MFSGFIFELTVLLCFSFNLVMYMVKQNSQTRVKNLAAFVGRFLTCVYGH